MDCISTPTPGKATGNVRLPVPVDFPVDRGPHSDDHLKVVPLCTAGGVPQGIPLVIFEILALILSGLGHHGSV